MRTRLVKGGAFRRAGAGAHAGALALVAVGLGIAVGVGAVWPESVAGAADAKGAAGKGGNPVPAPGGPPGIQPAAERTVDAGGPKRPQAGAAAQGPNRANPDSAGRPAVRGPKIPEALRARLKARLEVRVTADVAKTKELRTEAIDLLTRFVGEAPRESPEMPEALVRLGELQWENERDAFVERFEEWEKKPVDQRGPTPALDYRVARDLFARVLHDYPWFDQYDLALYVDGFLAFEQGKEDEARDRFERILRDYPDSRFVPDAHMAKAEAIFNGKFDYAGALTEYEKVLGYKAQIDPALYGLALFKSAWCYWRLGNNDEAAKRFVGVFEATDATPTADAAGKDKGKAVSAAERKQLDELQGEALKYIVEVFSEDEKNTAQDLYAFLTKIGGERFSGTIVRALAQQFYDQAHYERGIEAYELLLKLEPTGRDAPSWVLQIAAGYASLEDWPHVRSTFDRALGEYSAGGPWSRTQADSANVASTTSDIEKALREDAMSLHAKAQRDKTSNAEFEGAAGLYDAYCRSSRSRRTRTRCTSTSRRSTSFDWAETSRRRLITWRRRARSRRRRRRGPSRRCATMRSTMRSSPFRGQWTSRRRWHRRITAPTPLPTSTPKRSTSTRSITRRTPSFRPCSTGKAATSSTTPSTTRR